LYPCTALILSALHLIHGSAERLKGAFVTGLTPQCRYDKVSEALGGEGYFAETPEQVEQASAFSFAAQHFCLLLMPCLQISCVAQMLPKALACTTACVINIMINPSSQRKAQAFGWLSRADDVAKAAKL
jgi:hypothetical protein